MGVGPQRATQRAPQRGPQRATQAGRWVQYRQYSRTSIVSSMIQIQVHQGFGRQPRSTMMMACWFMSQDSASIRSLQEGGDTAARVL